MGGAPKKLLRLFPQLQTLQGKKIMRTHAKWTTFAMAFGIYFGSTFGAIATEPGKAGLFDWPQWQGLDRSAISRETGLLKSWPKEGPKELWHIKTLGAGYSTPTIAAGRIFTMGNRDGAEYVIALNEADGKELWAYKTGPQRENHGGYPGPRCSPTVEGDVLYALGLGGDLVCLKVNNGEPVWKIDIQKDFAGAPGNWGYAESPLIDGDRLLVSPGGNKATVLCLKKKDGTVEWAKALAGGEAAAYASMSKIEVEGVPQYIQFLSGGVVGLDAKDGQFLWRYSAPSAGINCSTPIFKDGVVYAAAAYGKGGGAAKITKTGDKFQANEVYFNKRNENHHGGLVLIDGFLYGEGSGNLSCLDFVTGKEAWRERKAGKGSITAAEGMLYYRNEGGPIHLVEVNKSAYVEKGRFEPTVKTGLPAWPHPVIANGKLYIRDQEHLFCYDVKAK